MIMDQEKRTSDMNSGLASRVSKYNLSSEISSNRSPRRVVVVVVESRGNGIQDSDRNIQQRSLSEKKMKTLFRVRTYQDHRARATFSHSQSVGFLPLMENSDHADIIELLIHSSRAS